MTFFYWWGAALILFVTVWVRLSHVYRKHTPRGRSYGVVMLWLVKEERFIGPFIDEDTATLWAVDNVVPGVLFGVRPLEDPYATGRG